MPQTGIHSINDGATGPRGGGGGGGGGGGRLLVSRVPMREQRTAKFTLNGVFDILKLVPLFILSRQNVTLSNVVN